MKSRGLSMKNNLSRKSVLLAIALGLGAIPPSAQATQNIINSYQNPRLMGMGGMKLTTGLYEENFTGNPARVTANPKWKVQLIDFAADLQPSAIGNVSSLVSAASTGDIESVTDSAGQQNHLRVSPTLLGVYIPHDMLSVAFAIQGSVQADAGLSRSLQLDSQIIGDVGPTLTLGRRFLTNKELSLGLSAHYRYRLSGRPTVTLSDLLTGGSLGDILSQTGEGSKFDFDLGSTYILPWRPSDLEVMVAASINNVLASSYSGGLQLLGGTGSAFPATRAFGLGITARKAEFWKLKDTSLGLEIQNMGSNGNGSFFRMLHIGSETHWKIIAMRLGINQGYITAGLGFDFKVAQLDFATFGEEMSLNTGGRENRTFAVRLGFHISPL
jgi:hypothetical protein